MDGELEEDLRAKEEELSKVKQERDELRETLKTVESKLSELQSKNNVSTQTSQYILCVCVPLHVVCTHTYYNTDLVFIVQH